MRRQARTATLTAVDADEPGLVRYWFEFDLSGQARDRDTHGLLFEGETPTMRLLGLGAGVTGYDQADCLRLLRDVLGEELPPLLRAERNPKIDEAMARTAGNVAWRGIWRPPLNLAGPTIG